MDNINYIRHQLTTVGDPAIFDNIAKKYQPYDKVKKLQDYLWEVTINKDTPIEYVYSEHVYEKYFNFGKCTSVRSGDWYVRNLDWFYNNNTDVIFLVEGNDDRYASVSVASASDFISDESLWNSIKPETFRVMHAGIVDGINEKGLACNTNVAPNNGTGLSLKGTNPGKPNMCATMVLRYALDKCANVREVEDLLNSYNIWFTDDFGGYEVHWMFADNNETLVVECIDGELKFMYDKECADYGWAEKLAVMTNFHLYDTHLVEGQMVRGNADGTSSPSNIEALGSGVERYNIALNGSNNMSSLNECMDLADDLHYDNAYVYLKEENENDPWYTEFVGGRKQGGGIVTSYSTEDEYKNATMTDPATGEQINMLDAMIDAYNNNTRDDYDDDTKIKTWTTTHTTVFDIPGKIIYVRGQSVDGERFIYQYSLTEDE